MKRPFLKKLISFSLAMITAFSASVATFGAAAADNSGKYVKDVYIAYGEKKEDAEAWLKKNGWEPIADLNEGKSSKATGKHNAVAMMGIKRTSDPDEAITDMATMYMKGGYSFDDYDNLVAKKKKDITEFINTFVPALEEYRQNYSGKGSKGGKIRAQAAHDLLNKFYDGDPNDEYAVNDTGKPLGDLLLNETKTEIGDSAYESLSDEEKKNTADLQQIILESTGPAVLLIEQALALATDSSKKSWMDRLDGLTGNDLVNKIDQYAPEAAGQDLASSAALTLLAAHFEDYATKLAEQWSDVNEDIRWYEEYCEENGFAIEGSTDAEDGTDCEEFFAQLQEEDEARYQEEFTRFSRVSTYYFAIKKVNYSGDWGDKLYDFLRPEDEDADYSEDIEAFAPLAASLSDGQRAALEFISLSTLLKLGVNSAAVTKADFPSVEDAFSDKDGEELENISIYSGMNRAIFRKGVALTSKALEQKSFGKDPYDILWDEFGLVDILSYATLGAGFITLAAGAAMAIYSARALPGMMNAMGLQMRHLKDVMRIVELRARPVSDFNYIVGTSWTQEEGVAITKMAELGTSGRWMMGIGGAFMLIAAALKGAELYQFYHRDFSAIPTMMVDEADIVSHDTDEEGNQVELIDFDQFAYYEVVKCNRQEIGIHTNAQNGVADYKEWGCGDAADINADVGKQWVALYVNRSSGKGNPILADSLKLQKGSDKTPSDCNGWLHMFNYKNPVKIDDIAYCYREDNKGMYLFWKSDESAYTASTFSQGYLALTGIGGLALGIFGTSLVMTAKRKKQKHE